METEFDFDGVMPDLARAIYSLLKRAVEMPLNHISVPCEIGEATQCEYVGYPGQEIERLK
jgi:hypothetical protein